MYASVLKS